MATAALSENYLQTESILKSLGVKPVNPSFSTGRVWGKIERNRTIKEIFSPADGSKLASVYLADSQDWEDVVSASQNAFDIWKAMPAPQRGEIIRQIGDRLRVNKDALGRLVSIEMGKILQEGLGEVQEMIDICDFAVGLSRQLYGLTMHSERPDHRMYEQYHPLGTVGIISAFNFPVAVWSWNAMLAAVCGDTCIWKPSEKTPLTSIACQHIISEVLEKNNLPEGIFNLIIGDANIGKLMSEDERIPLVSATGSTRMGKKVGEKVGARLGRALLELGGNNAIIISEHADIEMAIRATVFGAVGTCGQRCTSTRRLIVHDSIYDHIKERLIKAYDGLPIGNPLKDGILVGPLVDRDAVTNFENALKNVVSEGGRILTGGSVLSGDGFENGQYVTPAIVEAKNEFHTVQ